MNDMHSLKVLTANSLGIDLRPKGENGNLTARQCGAIGGHMVKYLIEAGKKAMEIKGEKT